MNCKRDRLFDVKLQENQDSKQVQNTRKSITMNTPHTITNEILTNQMRWYRYIFKEWNKYIYQNRSYNGHHWKGERRSGQTNEDDHNRPRNEYHVRCENEVLSWISGLLKKIGDMVSNSNQ